MQFQRFERVQELLRHEISLWIQQELSRPVMGFLTITSVQVSHDLSDAKVFFSVLGSEEDKENTSKVLQAVVPELRRYLSRKLESLRRIPQMRFVFDDTPEKAQRVDFLLKEISQEHSSNDNGNGDSGKPRRRSPAKKNKPKK